MIFTNSSRADETKLKIHPVKTDNKPITIQFLTYLYRLWRYFNTHVRCSFSGTHFFSPIHIFLPFHSFSFLCTSLPLPSFTCIILIQSLCVPFFLHLSLFIYIHSFSFSLSSYRTFSSSLYVSMLHQFIRYEFQKLISWYSSPFMPHKKDMCLQAQIVLFLEGLICIPPPSCSRVISRWSTSSTGCVHELELCCQYRKKGKKGNTRT